MNVFELDLTVNSPFRLESGVILPQLRLRTTIYGRLNGDKSNAIHVFHALTGSSRIADWWPGMIGDGKALDTSKHAFICINYIGSCYGSTSAADIESVVTTNDIIRSQAVVFEYLGIKRFDAVIGASVGGMLALQFAVDFPGLANKVISIGAAPLSAMGLALNHIQRKALDIENDVNLARQVATLSYKSHEILEQSYGRNPNRNGEVPHDSVDARFDVAGYLDHQGQTFTKRFDVDSFRLITKAMDLFDISDDQIARITAGVTLIGISSDWLFPASDVQRLAERLKKRGKDAEYILFDSKDGHDAFLSDIDGISGIIKPILSREHVKLVGDVSGSSVRRLFRIAA
ncbi:MAG: alpha/beta fold hydrolase [Pyrinomonadaceae bacterium]